MTTVLSVIGTRPEAIKLAPVIGALERRNQQFQSLVGFTGQHAELLDQVADVFGITPDFNLRLMRQNQSLSGLTSRIITQMDVKLRELHPDLVIVQGDTTTAFATALTAFYHEIPVAHVEAGLRTKDKSEPFPEEINRRLVDNIADLYFAPTRRSQENLRAEGVSPESIFVTGNTVVDALHQIGRLTPPDRIRSTINSVDKYILLTAHRRENFGLPLQRICKAVTQIAERFPDVAIVYPVHPNPNVRNKVEQELGSLENVLLLRSVDYLSFIFLLKNAYLVLTDSGGIQEEAPSFSKPVLVLRDRTERTELISEGGGKLVGSDPALIVKEATRLIRNDAHYREMATSRNPFGDGRAAERIVSAIHDRFGRPSDERALSSDTRSASPSPA